MVLPVRLCCQGENETSAEAIIAHTVDISPVGAQLGGFRAPLQPGEVIVLQHRHKKGSFRVIWTRQLGPAEARAGIEWVEIEKSAEDEINFWGLELPKHISPLPAWLRPYQ